MRRLDADRLARLCGGVDGQAFYLCCPADDGPADPWATTDGCESASHPYGPLFALTLLSREWVTVQRFRLMGIYVVLVVAALGCAIAGIAVLRAASAH